MVRQQGARGEAACQKREQRGRLSVSASRLQPAWIAGWIAGGEIPASAVVTEFFGRRVMQMKTGTTEPGKIEAGSRTRRETTADPETERCRMIAEAAYYRAQERNFCPGNELDDWLQAERDIDAKLNLG